MPERTIGILTEDPVLYGELAQLLQAHKALIVSLLPGEEVPSRVQVIVTSEKEAPAIDFPLVVAARRGMMLEAWAHLQIAMGVVAARDHLVVGIDPGPRPGYAIMVGQGTFIASGVVESPEEVGAIGRYLRKTLPENPLVFRVGNGDHVRQSRIMKVILQLGIAVELVDERGTTPHGRRNNDPVSAEAIAMSGGRVVEKVPVHQITEKELRNVQHLSRESTCGRLSIPRDLASEVLKGRMTLNEAVIVAEKTIKKRAI